MHRYEIKNQSEPDGKVSMGLKLNLVRSKSTDEKTTKSELVAKSPKIISKLHKSEVRKDQQCSRCRNHGKFQLLRGHKNACPFANCICSKCEITMKRREIMAKQIKDYRNLKTTDEVISSPEVLESPEIVPDFENLCVQHFVDYEPMENRDLFFMIQSLYEKYANQNNENKIQLIYAFAHLAKGNWDEIEKALEKGEMISSRFKITISIKKSFIMESQTFLTKF
jgi:DM DNA binding domain